MNYLITVDSYSGWFELNTLNSGTSSKAVIEKLKAHFSRFGISDELSRYPLQTNSQLLLKVPRTRCKTFGDRAFVFAAPKIGNNLPLAVRESETNDCFKTRLKTFLFKSAFEC